MTARAEPRILVTGAAGVVVQAIVNQLLAVGVRPRVSVPGGDVAWSGEDLDAVEGDVTVPESLHPALAGIDAMLLTPGGVPQREALAGIVDAGIQRIVLLSSASAPWERAQPRAGRHFLAWEEAVEATGLAWTHIRPAGLMAVAWEWIEDIRRDGVVRHAFPAARYPYVHERDVADVATAALLDERHTGARYLVTGPTAINGYEQVRDLAEATGRPLRLEELTEDEAIARWRARGYDQDSIDIELIVLRDHMSKPPRPRRTVQKVLARPALPFSRWAIDHAADFL